MLRKVIIKKYTLLLILSVFCFSSGTLGGFLLYGHEVHFDHNNAHTHHTNEDHGLGDTDHEDEDIILSLDYLVSKSSSLSKTDFTLNPFLHFSLSSKCFLKFFNSTLKPTHCSDINNSTSTGLYQHHSSYLI